MDAPQNAFPVNAVAPDGTPVVFPGLTVRDYYMAAVLPAIITVNAGDNSLSMRDAIDIAGIYADALVEERKKHV